MRVKVESHQFDDLAEAVVYSNSQLGGGPDESNATEALIDCALGILECACEEGWEPPAHIKAELEKLTDLEEDEDA